jgi:hypothetical protein
MGWLNLFCQGSIFYDTPNIDRPAADGMRFTDAYAACPVCSPTRASILSGKYPARLGLTHFIAASEANQQGTFTVGKLLGVPCILYFPPGKHPTRQLVVITATQPGMSARGTSAARATIRTGTGSM